MKLKILFSFLLFLLVPYTMIIGQGFRENKWGSTKAQVVKVEGKPKQDDGDEISYDNKIVGEYGDVLTYFYFHPKYRLVYCHYVFIDLEHKAIKQIGRSLESKYGPAKVKMGKSGFKQFHWSPKGTHIAIQYDDIGFTINYYKESYWIELANDLKKRRQQGL